MTRRYSNRAKRHAKESKMRSERMLKQAKFRGGPVTVSWLPGFEPPPEPARSDPTEFRTQFPFPATINGRPTIIHEHRTEYL